MPDIVELTFSIRKHFPVKRDNKNARFSSSLSLIAIKRKIERLRSQKLQIVKKFDLIECNLCLYRVIQQSHPVCNTIMLSGVITCLVSVILLGLDGQFVEPSTYPKVSASTCIINATTFDSTTANKSLGLMKNFTIIIIEQRPKVRRVSQWNINESPSEAIYQSF